ncbi:DUF1554 domain-containing protein [Leptospira haakeii]|uniref:DUF1554 domain-containing protein n=1 Tax=Leptospira haakeii TaxID=2023198 RepID=A0ABX4PIY6_9LEPT|nr:DUF1554 domain-containing protein [Leptospira haakeii]PKA15725.1 hypothetical protein CH363_11985 [Leptospira haakeii]PKA18598.1 hypothetical protein CH377_16470 [Leptospira haakeii]
MRTKRVSLLFTICFSISLVSCAIKSENSGDPNTQEYYENAIINCFISGCDKELIITGGNSLPEGGSLVLSISLVHKPDTSVTYNFSSSNPAIASVSPSSLMFTPSNYTTSQTLTITGGSDDSDSTDNSIVISILTPNSETIPYSVLQKDNDKFLFATNATYAGNFGSGGFADFVCQNEANNLFSSGLPTGTYKTFAVAGTWRRAIPSKIDWVLLPNKDYIDFAGGTFVKAFATDANALFSFGTGSGISATAAGYWTGLQTDWSTANTCQGWTSNGSIDQGNFASSADPSVGGISAGTPDFCNLAKSVVCVQQ